MKKIVLLLLAFWASVSWSQPVRPAGPLSMSEYLWYKASGNPNAEIRPMVLGPGNTGNHAYFVNPDGSIGAKARTPYAPSRGAPIVLDVASTVPKSNVLGAVGRFLGKSAAAFSGPLMIGVAAFDFAAEAGFLVTKGPDRLHFFKDEYAADCDYSGLGRSGITGASNSTPYDTAKAQLCPDSRYVCLDVVTYPSPGFCRQQIQPIYQGTKQAIFDWRTSKVISSTSQKEFSHQEFLDEIASKSGWPPSSALARTLDDALKDGETVDTTNPTLSGPATSPGTPTIKTVNTTNNTTTTTNNTNNYNYDGPNIKVTNVTSFTVTNNITNETVSEETTEQEEEPEPEDVAEDTPLADIPTLYERQYPDGLTGVWNDKKAELLETPLLQLTTNLMPTIATTGGYPYWPIPVVIGPWNFGTFDASPASYVWDFLKVCVILGALFLARALIFGG